MKNTLLYAVIVLSVFWASLLYKVAVSSMPHNPLSSSKSTALNMSLILPQGWAFFTKSPRDAGILAYKKENDQFLCVNMRNAGAENLFGLSRRARVQGVELGSILGKLKGAKWFECKDGLKSINLDTIKSIVVLNAATSPTFDGEYILEEKKIVPWAWSQSANEITMPSKIIKINVICTN